MSIFSKIKINALDLYVDAYEFLQRKYEQAREVFSPASPFGQLLSVSSNHVELILFYIENAISELNISRAKNIESVYGLSRLTGHDPTRGISARGTLGLRLSTGASSFISGNYLEIPNYARIEIEENGLPYFLKSDEQWIRLELTNREFTNVEIIQGEWEEQGFRGTGNPLQSFNVITKEPTDNDMVEVEINGEKWERVESLYDMNKDSKSFLCKTSITSGLSIFFGTGGFGYIPPLGSNIKVRYVKSRGNAGNIGGKTINFKFIDSGIDESGNEITLDSDKITINPIKNPMFGSDTEDPEFTRNIAPHMSKSFVLANPNNYIHFLSKYDYFSFIDAYVDDDRDYVSDNNIIYLFLIPDIQKKLESNVDYFNVDETEFSLREEEKKHIYDTIEKSGRQLVSSEIKIINPTIKRYITNIILSIFKERDKEAIKTEIRNRLNNYFLSIKRRDKIPRSDLIGIIEDIEGVDSVNVFFISEENERALRNGFYQVPQYSIDRATGLRVLTEKKKINLEDGENPLLGLNTMGDILIGKNELPIIRGGFRDRNNNLYEAFPGDDKNGSLNIYFSDEVQNDVYNKIKTDRLKEIKKN